MMGVGSVGVGEGQKQCAKGALNTNLTEKEETVISKRPEADGIVAQQKKLIISHKTHLN